LRQKVEEEEAVLLMYSARLEVDHGDGSLAAVVLRSVQNNKKTKGKGKPSGGVRRGKELGFPMGFRGGLKGEEEKGSCSRRGALVT
jgi:hypothetical protein